MTDDRIVDVDCSAHGPRECPYRDDVVRWFLRHPIHSHCGCDACLMLLGEGSDAVAVEDAEDDR
jgi:hypothetical protein